MKINDQDVNNLFLNGQNFSAINAIGPLFNFDQTMYDNLTWYYPSLKSDGSINYFGKCGSNIYASSNTWWYNPVPIFKRIVFENEEYFLMHGCIRINYTTGFVDVQQGAFWVKSKDLSNYEPYSKNGGVNSPFYLQLIYNMEVVPPC
ncbi:hypothetical protein [Lactobacillus rizhaonensis]|uniref:hypothetical protein n=1 Tax=Lactobacillus rizhaonensis TaxID=3082863 RepID=UPI0030C681A0